MISPRLIRRRIKSVANTGKITKALELVAAAKMRRAVTAVLASRPYAAAAWRAVEQIAATADPRLHPLLMRRSTAGRTLVILFASDRGLCGGFNQQLLKALQGALGADANTASFVAVGRKGQDWLRRRGRSIIAAFDGLGNVPRSTDIRPLSELVRQDFIAGVYDTVQVAYTDYRSALNQVPVIRQLLPIVRIEGLGETGRRTSEAATAAAPEFVFEPSPEAVLATLLPRLVEVQIYQALLESTASEHSARMLTMRSATEAAEEMIDGLSLAYNQARQAGITREIAEISAGKAAIL